MSFYKCFLVLSGILPLWKTALTTSLKSKQTVFADVPHRSGNGFKYKLLHHLPRIKVIRSSLCFPGFSLHNFLLKWCLILNFPQQCFILSLVSNWSSALPYCLQHLLFNHKDKYNIAFCNVIVKNGLKYHRKSKIKTRIIWKPFILNKLRTTNTKK